MEWIAVLVLVGLVTGLLAGLLGIGGGVITVPALYYFLSYFGFPEETVMHVSIATALASTLITSSGSTWSHQKKGAKLFPALKFLLPGLFFGCVVGAVVAHFLSSNLLKDIFGVMVIGLGIFFFFPHLIHPRFADEPNSSLVLWGLLVGCLSTLLGVGGGTFMVPILLGYAISLQNTVATSSAGTLATAFFGTILYLLIGWNRAHFPYVISYIYLPGFLAIGFGSLLTTRWGVKLAHTLPTPLIKRIFACALIATGLAMLLRD